MIKMTIEQNVRKTLTHLEKLQADGEEIFGTRLWKPEIHLLKQMLK